MYLAVLTAYGYMGVTRRIRQRQNNFKYLPASGNFYKNMVAVSYSFNKVGLFGRFGGFGIINSPVRDQMLPHAFCGNSSIKLYTCIFIVQNVFIVFFTGVDFSVKRIEYQKS